NLIAEAKDLPALTQNAISRKMVWLQLLILEHRKDHFWSKLSRFSMTSPMPPTLARLQTLQAKHPNMLTVTSEGEVRANLTSDAALTDLLNDPVCEYITSLQIEKPLGYPSLELLCEKLPRFRNLKSLQIRQGNIADTLAIKLFGALESHT